MLGLQGGRGVNNFSSSRCLLVWVIVVTQAILPICVLASHEPSMRICTSWVPCVDFAKIGNKEAEGKVSICSRESTSHILVAEDDMLVYAQFYCASNNIQVSQWLSKDVIHKCFYIIVYNNFLLNKSK